MIDDDNNDNNDLINNWRVPSRRMRKRGLLFHVPEHRTNHWFHGPLRRMSRLANEL